MEKEYTQIRNQNTKVHDHTCVISTLKRLTQNSDSMWLINWHLENEIKRTFEYIKMEYAGNNNL